MERGGLQEQLRGQQRPADGLDPQPSLRRGRGLGLKRPFVAQAGLRAVQSLIYLLIAALLIAAAAFTLVGTIVDVIEGSDSRQIADTGVFILDRVLLIFIIGELLYTLRLIEVGGQILVEPFLFIGLIAVVRRVLVLTAEFEGGDADATDFLIQIGALAGLALVLVLSIYLLRRSSGQPAPE
jgi:uncharacterized membrane protein (DUF373 family)